MYENTHFPWKIVKQHKIFVRFHNIPCIIILYMSLTNVTFMFLTPIKRVLWGLNVGIYIVHPLFEINNNFGYK